MPGQLQVEMAVQAVRSQIIRVFRMDDAELEELHKKINPEPSERRDLKVPAERQAVIRICILDALNRGTQHLLK